MARSGFGARGWRGIIVCFIAIVLLGGCGVPDEFPTPTPTREASPTPTATTEAIPSPTSTGTTAPETATTGTTPTIALSPSPLSLRPTATTPPTPTAAATPTSPTAESDQSPNQTISGTTTATSTSPGPGPAPTVLVVNPEATATGIPIATIEPTVAPLPTATPTIVPEPTPTPTATLVPEPTATPDLCPGAIPWYDAINYLGAYATVIGPVVDTEWAEEAQGKPTFLNVGLPYPDPGRFTVLMWIDARWNFDFAPEEVYLGSTICVTGTIALYEGSAEMIIEGPEWIWVP